jgi:hypothetical protein
MIFRQISPLDAPMNCEGMLRFAQFKYRSFANSTCHGPTG